MAMQRFFEFFRRKNYGALWNNLFNLFHLRSSAMRVKFSQIYKKITSSFGVDYFLPLPLLSNTKPCKNRIQQIINPNFARNLPQIIECMSNIHRD